MSKNKKIIDLTKKNEISDNDILAINDISANEVKKIKISTIKNYSSTGDFVESVNGLSGDVEITTYEVAENTNLYFTEFRIVNDLISQNPSVLDTDKSLSLKALKDYVFNLVETAITTMEFWVRSYIDVNFVPPQVGNEDKFLKTDGVNASWEQIDDNDIFVTANNLNKNLKDVIEDGDLDKVFQWPAFGDINAQIDLINEIKKLELPVGFIIEFAGDIPPANFLIANGQAISRTTYAELFSVIGTKYGAGDGSTTFNLPNLNNEFGRYTTNTSLIGNKHGHSTARPTTAFSTGASGAHTHANTNSIENQLNFSGEVILPNGKDALSTTEDFIRSYSGNYLLLRDATALSSRIELTTVNVGTPNNVDFDLSSSTSSGSTSSATHSHTITAGGDSETAPRHIMLLACIKVK